jgi:hypothetical protein
VLIITDVDHDEVNEVIVGTKPYRDPIQVGAVYVFHWDGARFVTEYSDYCMGGVQRLDVANLRGEDLMVVSTFRRPLVFGSEVNTDMCPRKDIEESYTGLYLLRASGPNEYESHPLIIDDNRRTSLIIPSRSFSETLFARTSSIRTSGTTIVDWTTTKFMASDGCMLEEPLKVGAVLALQMEMADLDGDGNHEVVVLAAKNYSEPGAIGVDNLVWQVYQGTRDEYLLVYEGPTTYTHLFYFFEAGDIDGDGAAEIVESSGEIYEWTGERLSSQANLLDAVGKNLCYGLESIYIGDLFGDGQNRIVFTGRYADEGEICSDTRPPRMYVVHPDYATPPTSSSPD